jgi:hypothetical protein
LKRYNKNNKEYGIDTSPKGVKEFIEKIKQDESLRLSALEEIKTKIVDSFLDSNKNNAEELKKEANITNLVKSADKKDTEYLVKKETSVPSENVKSDGGLFKFES